jgi:hypothetical protein
MDLDLDLTVGLGRELLRPRLDHVHLEKARRSEEMAEGEGDGLGGGGIAVAQRRQQSRAKQQRLTFHVRSLRAGSDLPSHLTHHAGFLIAPHARMLVATSGLDDLEGLRRCAK